MLIVCLAANLGIGGGTICFELLAVFFPKEMARVIAASSRGLRRLKCQPDQPSSTAVAPLLDARGATGIQRPVFAVHASFGLFNISLSFLPPLTFTHTHTPTKYRKFLSSSLNLASHNFN